MIDPTTMHRAMLMHLLSGGQGLPPQGAPGMPPPMPAGPPAMPGGPPPMGAPMGQGVTPQVTPANPFSPFLPPAPPPVLGANPEPGATPGPGSAPQHAPLPSVGNNRGRRG